MVAGGLRTTQGGDRARKRAGRRPRGVQVFERNGYWHARGVVRAGGRSIRVRQSLDLAVDRYSESQAEDAARDLEFEIRARAEGKLGRGDPVGIAALSYLSTPRARPLRPSSIRIVQKIVAQFGERRLNEIPDEDWFNWIDGDVARGRRGLLSGVKSATRERFLNGVAAFLTFAVKNHGLARLPAFHRDRRAVTPNRRARRRVEDLREDLIAILLSSAHIAIRAQLVVEVATGARVSSVLHGARLCDLNLAPGREAILFRGTKSGEDVRAVIGAGAAAELRAYLTWRGDLYDREAPLFLTPKREPYADNGGVYGSQNRKGFEGAKRRARKAIRDLGAAIARRLRLVERPAAAAAIGQARADADLIGKITQHWFRHRLATLWIRRDPRAAMEQGGWLDIRSMMGYAQDVPEFRRQVATDLDFARPARRHG